ncbi:MAG: carboxylating nicotinate-nucleotide diphosphorylase [Planctomycetota bacterium]
MSPNQPSPPSDPFGFGPSELEEARWLFRRAQEEDLPSGDLTTDALFPKGEGGSGIVVEAAYVFREPGVVCGIPVLAALFSEEARGVQLEALEPEGRRLESGSACLRVRGPAEEILRWERISLNFFQRLSGIATGVRRWVEALAGTSAELLDTRKTTPAWRRLEKYAVRVGGAKNHRGSLSDAFLVKDNHKQVLLALGEGKFEQGIVRLRERRPDVFLEVEVDSREEFQRALEAPLDAILLDNFSLSDLRWAVETRNRSGRRRPLLEASGGVRLETVRAIAETGVDRISAGSLTHSARAVDVGLDVLGVRRQGRNEGARRR